MPKNIFINDTAATTGGALTVLRQLLDYIKDKDKTNNYFVFCTADLFSYNNNNLRIINVKGKKKIDRLYWDNFGMKRWSTTAGIKADVILSLQNTGVKYFKNTKQIVYIHQSIPFERDLKWSLFKRGERACWFYKYVYEYFIRSSIDDKTMVVVQQQWMKSAVMQRFNLNEKNIRVIPPSKSSINFNEIQEVKLDNSKLNLFYPAAAIIYKNHKVLLEAIALLREKEEEVFNKVNLILTIKEEELTKEMKKIIDTYQLKNKIEFLGYIAYEKVYSYYKSCSALLFPSYMESFGLPLLEAAKFGLPIIAAKRDYSLEALDGYSGVKYVSYNSKEEWCCEIIRLSHDKNCKYESYEVNNPDSYGKIIDLF